MTAEIDEHLLHRATHVLLSLHLGPATVDSARIRKVAEAIRTAQAEARLEERRAIAEMVDDFSWTLPMYKSADMNEASDDAAESVRRQIAKAIWGL